MLGAINDVIAEEMKTIAKTYLDDRLKKIYENFKSLSPLNKKVIS